jgi:hypothetical protein
MHARKCSRLSTGGEYAELNRPSGHAVSPRECCEPARPRLLQIGLLEPLRKMRACIGLAANRHARFSRYGQTDVEPAKREKA